MEPQIFKVDPTAIEESERFKAIGWLSFASRNGQALRTEINNDTVSAGDEVTVYDDHLEKKRNGVIETIFFKDIVGVNFTKSASGKVLFFHIIQKDKDTVIVGMEKMDDLLAAVTAHLPPSDVAQRVFGETYDGKAVVSKMLLRTVFTIVFLLVAYLLIYLFLGSHS